MWRSAKTSHTTSFKKEWNKYPFISRSDSTSRFHAEQMNSSVPGMMMRIMTAVKLMTASVSSGKIQHVCRYLIYKYKSTSICHRIQELDSITSWGVRGEKMLKHHWLPSVVSFPCMMSWTSRYLHLRKRSISFVCVKLSLLKFYKARNISQTKRVCSQWKQFMLTWRPLISRWFKASFSVSLHLHVRRLGQLQILMDTFHSCSMWKWFHEDISHRHQRQCGGVNTETLAGGFSLSAESY